MNRLQSWLAVQVMESAEFESEFRWFEFKDDSDSRCAGVVGVKGDASTSIVFNLPRRSSHFFLTATDGVTKEIARVMAHLDEIDETDEIHQSHVVRFPYDYLAAHGIVGVLLSNIKVSPLLSFLGCRLEFLDFVLYPTLVIFITQSEYDIWKVAGSDGLMDHFDSQNKNLVSIAQGSA